MYSCNQLGLLPCKPTRTPSCNPAPRVYKGSRGTPLEDRGSSIQTPRNDQVSNLSRNTLPSIREIQPQTGCRVLPPLEGPNLSKPCVLFQASCATIILVILQPTVQILLSVTNIDSWHAR